MTTPTHPKTVHVEPLTAEEEAEWRRWAALPRGRAARWLSADVDRLWATLDAARQPASPDLRAALYIHVPRAFKYGVGCACGWNDKGQGPGVWQEHMLAALQGTP